MPKVPSIKFSPEADADSLALVLAMLRDFTFEFHTKKGVIQGRPAFINSLGNLVVELSAEECEHCGEFKAARTYIDPYELTKVIFI